MSDSMQSRLAHFHQAAIDGAQLTNGGVVWDDFGGDEYQPGLNALASSFDRQADNNALSTLQLEQMIINVLKGRLYSEHFKKAHPTYVQQKIQRPIFIVGLPRSGTTALHKMLTADPRHQGLEYWLGQSPMPRLGKGLLQPEFKACVDQLATLKQFAPDLFALHEMSADKADECRLLLMQSFANVTFQSSAWVPEYEEWLYEADFKSVYQRYKENLQLISLNDTRQWILKDPSHLWAPETLLECFPDACFIQTHRHPIKLIPSVSSLVYSSRKVTDPDIDKERVGQRELRQWSKVLNNWTTVRREHDALPVYDVYMEDLLDDPLQALKQIYQHFELTFDDDSEKGVEHWLAHQSDGPGGHRYSAEEFGVTEREINATFSDYIATLRYE